MAVITQALVERDWNQTRAAEALDLPRRTLVHKIKQYGIDRRSSQADITAAVGKRSPERRSSFRELFDNRYEATLLQEVLRATGNDRREVAAQLEISARTLRSKLKKHGL